MAEPEIYAMTNLNSVEEHKHRNQDQDNKPSLWRQVFAACTIAFGATGVGYGASWSSPALTDLQDCEDDPELHPDGCTFDHEFTEEEGSWIASIYPLGGVFSTVLAYITMQLWGRKPTIQLACIPYTIGWLILTLAKPLELDTVAWFYSGRFLSGLGAGTFFLTGPIYVMELCRPEIRGAIGNLIGLFSITGTFVVNLFGAFMDWTALSVIALIPPITTLVLVTFFIPESPFHLIVVDKVPKAGNSLRRLRGPKYDYDQELEGMQKALQEVQMAGKVSWKDLLTKRVYIVPLLIIVMLQIFGQMSGVSAATMYLSEIFIKAGFDVDNSLWYGAAVAACQVAGAICSLFMIESFGRRILLIVSGLGMGLSMTLLATFFYLDDHVEVICPEEYSTTSYVTTTLRTTLCVPSDGFSQETIDDIGWLPLASLITFKFTFAIGFAPLPLTLCGEFFSSEAKDVSSFISIFTQILFVFLTGKYQVNVENAIGTAGLYYLFAGFGLASVAFVILFVPETKGRSPDEMREIFRKNKHNKH